MSSYQAIVSGLHAVFATVPGIVNVLDYAPASIQDTPTLYSLLDNVAVSKAGQITTRKFRIQHQLLVRWQDNEQAELEILPFIDSIPAALAADPQLSGAIHSGWAEITDIDAGWITITGVDYRSVDFYSLVVDKG